MKLVFKIYYKVKNVLVKHIYIDIFHLSTKYQNELNIQKLVPQTERCLFEGTGMRNKEYEKGDKAIVGTKNSYLG